MYFLYADVCIIEDYSRIMSSFFLLHQFLVQSTVPVQER